MEREGGSEGARERERERKRERGRASRTRIAEHEEGRAGRAGGGAVEEAADAAQQPAGALRDEAERPVEDVIGGRACAGR